MSDDLNLEAGFIDDPPPRRAKLSRLDDLIDFAKEHNLPVGSTTGGRHNIGSRHYSGNAIDIKGSGSFSNERVNQLKQAASARGFLVRDERTRPPKQKVWGGPHVHIEALDGQQGIDLSAGFEDQGQDTPNTVTRSNVPLVSATRTTRTPAPVDPFRGVRGKAQAQTPVSLGELRRSEDVVKAPAPVRPRSLAQSATVLPGVHQIINLLPEEDRENLVEGVTGALAGTVRQLANTQDLGLQITGINTLTRTPIAGRPILSRKQSFSRIPQALRSVSDAIAQTIPENQTLRPEPTSFAGKVRRGVGQGVGAASVELPKLILGGRVLGAANLPVQGALSRADEGAPGLIKGAAGGLLYHFGGQVTGKYLGKIGNSLVWVAGPTAERMITDPNADLASTLGENIPMGVFAGAGGAKKVRIKTPRGERDATLSDVEAIVKKRVEVIPPERGEDARSANASLAGEPVRRDAKPSAGSQDVAGGIVAPEQGLPSQRFQHVDFGEVQLVPDQSGARRSRLKVAEVSDPTKIHYVKKADMQGRGNARMIPIKEAQTVYLKEGFDPGMWAAFDSKQTQRGGLIKSEIDLEAGIVESPGEIKAKDILETSQASSPQPPESIAKQPWQMTRAEYSKQGGEVSYSAPRGATSSHRDAVEDAVARGEKVSPEVLKDYPWLAADDVIKPYVEGLSKLTDKELKAEAERVGNQLNKWASDTRSFLPDGRLNPALGNQAYFEISNKFSAIDREIDARKFGQIPTPSVPEGAQLPEGGIISRNQPKEKSVAAGSHTSVASEGAGSKGGTLEREIPAPAPESRIKRNLRGERLVSGERSDITLSQFVRKRGGVAPGEMYAGELDRLRTKESGTTGLINKRNRAGNAPMTAEYMMDAANEAGFRKPDGQRFDNVGDFLYAVERDAAGQKTQALTGAEIDFEKDYREHVKKQVADERERRAVEQSADNLVSLLESGRGGELFDKITANNATAAEQQEFRSLARRKFIRNSDIEDLIAEAKAEGVSTAFESPAETTRAASQAPPLEGLRTRAGEAGFTLLRAGRVRASTPILSEVEKITQAKEPRPSVRSRVAQIPERLQTAFTSQFTPLRKLEANLYGKKKVPIVDLARKFEQVAGSAGKAEADVYEFRRNVVEPIKAQADDFNSYLFLKRVQDRLTKEPEVKRVADWTIPKAEQGLAELEAKIGSEGIKKFEAVGKVYQAEMRKALQLQVDSGRMSKEMFDHIVSENDFYAPFKVLRWIEEGGQPSGTGRKIATTQALSKKITGIDSTDFQLGNILLASSEQIVRSRILAEKNLKMLELDKLADLDPTGDLIKRVSADSKPKRGYEQVKFFKEGKETILEVERPVAQAVQGLNPTQSSAVIKPMIIARAMLRGGATTFNTGFQAVNLFFADLPRATLVSRYGLRSPKDVYQFPLDWAYSLFSSFKGNFGKPNELYMDWLKSGAANSTIQRELTPESFKPPPLGMVGRRPAKAILDSVAKFSNAIEETSKVLGLRRGMRVERIATLPPAERQAAMDKIVAEVRNYSGSPDFARKGTEAQNLNLLFMFFNARLQGLSSDAARLAGKTGKPEAVAAWARLGTVIGLPTTLLALLNQSPEYKEDYDKIPEWERNSYWMIPRDSFFTNEDTEEQVRDYWRIPKRELGRLFANTIESAVNFGLERDPKTAQKWAVGMLENVSPVNIEGRTLKERGESVLGSTNPLLKLPVEGFTNRDLFRHREIVPDYMKNADPREQYRASTPRGYVEAGKRVGVSPLLVEHVTQGATGGGLGQFAVRQPQPGRSPLSQYPIVRRFVRSGSLASESGMGERVQQAERDESTKQVVRRRTAMSLLSQWRNKSDEEVTEQIATIAQSDPDLAEKITDIRKEQKRGLNSVDRQIAQLGIENGERERFIKAELARMQTRAEREAFLADLRKKGLIPGGPRQPREARQPRKLRRMSTFDQ